MRNACVSLAWKIACLFIAYCLCRPVLAENWPCWRGPRGDGSCLEKDVPVKWSGTENVAWKTAIPGEGHATPIVWEDRIFLVTALKAEKQRVLLCLDRPTGRILWRKVVLTAPFEKVHPLNNQASSTPCTDGRLVYVSFLDKDKMFVAAYDFSGKQVWAVRPGVFASKHGYCSSPILWRDKLIVNGDHDGPAYIVALDRQTGRTLWKTPRPNNTRSYCAPIIRRIGGRNQLILSGSKCVASYDPDTGKQHWLVDGPTEQYVASLVYNGELLFMTCGFPDRYMQGIDPTGSGNVTKTHVVWVRREDCSYVPSPVVFGDYFIVVDDTGDASCLAAKTGKLLWRERLKGRHSASLVTARGLVYFLSDRGRMKVVKPLPAFKVVAENDLGEKTNASPVFSRGQLFLRGDKHLFCIGKAAE